MKTEEMIRGEVFSDGIKYAKIYNKFRKIINDISCFNSLFDDLKYLEWYTTKTFDENIESFKEKFDNTYNIIERLEKTNWGGISLKTKELVNKFEEFHKDLCYRVASLKPWGQE